jgi:hypothetical protein
MTHLDEPEPPLPRSSWDALRDEEPDRQAMARAYLRFTTPRPVRIPRASLAGWFAAGIVGAWGVVALATGDPLLGASRYRALTEQARSTSAGAPRIPRRHSARPGAPAIPASASADPLVPTPELPAPSHTTPGASLAPFAPAPSGPAALDARWQRVAAALKAHDYAAAESGLRELEASTLPATREAGSLALAQVLLARGRPVEARSRLERLRASASTPAVQKRAESLLLELDAPAERSSAAPAATH